MEVENYTNQLKTLGKRVETLRDNVNTEEATKTSLVMPFFQLLGYDVFNPLEFVPEYTADVGIKKGEKVDYAIVINKEPVILVEVKAVGEKLDKHDSQLFRYFTTTTSKFGILTNGIEYKFYTDLDEPNKMDRLPFFTVDITKLRESHILELAKFHKNVFNVNNIVSTASELKYLYNVKSFLSEQLNSPSEEFVKYVLGEIYAGAKTKSVIERFTPIIKKGFTQFISESVNEKLNAALNTSQQEYVEETKDEIVEVEDEVVTTPEELECYAMVKFMLKDVVETDRVFYRDNRHYFNILLDDTIRKWIMRIYFMKAGIKLVFNDADKTTVEIQNPIDIAQYTDKIIEIVQNFK